MIHRDNLHTLACYLAGDTIEKPFDISVWSRKPRSNKNISVFLYEHECGTAACGVGHGPYAGFPIDGCRDWIDYCTKWFVDPKDDEAEFSWCFAGDWAKRDNTAIGVAKRIFWLLKHGLPDDWKQQMRGKAPLCYCDMQISEFTKGSVVLPPEECEALEADRQEA